MKKPNSTFPILLVAAAAVVATAVALPAAAAPATQRAAAKPAESTRVLPDVATVSSAVDNAGGSLVVGHSLHGSGPGIRAYYRSPSGTWRNSVQLLAESSFPGTLVETGAAAGPSGDYVIAWTFSDGRNNSAVYASVRSASGSFSKPRLVYTGSYENAAGAGAKLQLATNDNGDAVLTQADPQQVARYVRSTGKWTVYRVPDETGEADPSAAGQHKQRTIAMISASRTIDLTYAYGPQDQLQVIQQTLVDGSSTFARQAVTTGDPFDSHLTFDIAMDGDGLQTMAVAEQNGGLAWAFFRQSERRGSFETPPFTEDHNNGSVPHVAARGDYTRTSREAVDAEGNDSALTSLYRSGTEVSSAQETETYWGTAGMQTNMAIGIDGRGVEVEFGGVGADGFSTRGPTSVVYRSSYEAAPYQRTDQIMSRGSLEPPALDVGRTSVSQLVIHEAVKSGGRTVRRTVVYVRR